MNDDFKDRKDLAKDLRDLPLHAAPSHLKERIMLLASKRARMKKWKTGGIVIAAISLTAFLYSQTGSADGVLVAYKYILAPFVNLLISYISEPLNYFFGVVSVLLKMSLFVLTEKTMYLALLELFALSAAGLLVFLVKSKKAV